LLIYCAYEAYSAIQSLEVNAGADLFLGASGSGKSSLAGTLNQRGYRVITTDVSVLAFSPEGLPRVYPSCSNIKLCPDGLRNMGQNPKAHPQVLSDLEKYCVPREDGFCAQPRPVLQV
jgi:hypothetical protein